MSKRIGIFKEELEEMDKKIEELEAQNDAQSTLIETLQKEIAQLKNQLANGAAVL